MLLLGGDTRTAGALIEVLATAGAGITVIAPYPDLARELHDAFTLNVTVLTGDPWQQSALHQGCNAACARHGKIDAVIAVGCAFDEGIALLGAHAASNGATLMQVMDLGPGAYLRAARVLAPTLRTSAGCLILTLTAAALTPGRGGDMNTLVQQANAALVRQLALELAPDVRVYGVCVPMLPRAADGSAIALRQPDSDITAPHYLPDPTAWAATYLELLDPPDQRPASGSIVTAAGSTTIAGLVTLATV